MKRIIVTLLSVVFISANLSACSPVGIAAGGAATVGMAAMQEGGIEGAASDLAIKLDISDAWLKHDFDMFRKLDMTVKEGRVLVTGSVPNPDMRVDAIRLAWQAEGVKQVLNEVSVEDDSSILTYVNDSVITGSLRTRLMFDKKINSVNYSIDTNEGNVYLMGVAHDQQELDLVIEHARNTKSVANVINYVRLREESLNNIAK